MLFVYHVSIKFYSVLLLIFSFFNTKAKLWVAGRKNLLKKIEDLKISEPTIWFHFASLGEFEQGRPVLEKLRNSYPDKKVVITFFSPSGYEVRKNSPLADYVFYLPIDTPTNASKFIDLIKPQLAVFTKYEYWYYYFNELNNRRIPLYVISAIFRKEMSFFKWYGIIPRKCLSLVSYFFVQDQHSKILLEEMKLNNVIVSGDTRFDRVFENSKTPKRIELVERFTSASNAFIAGSTWPEDEKLLPEIYKVHADWKFVIAPHEISNEKIKYLESLFPQNAVVKYSEAQGVSNISEFRVLIIDNIGMLSSLYQYGDVGYIGGGFGAGIHNTLEAAAFGMPVIFGPKYQKFREAKELIRIGAAFSISDGTQLKQITAKLMDQSYRRECADLAADYVKEHTGATTIIINHITSKLRTQWV
jgi:3-deoxy-D-manno-octulosonic-acid transferase